MHWNYRIIGVLLAMMLCYLPISAQNISVSGTVFDEEGEPAIGAAVMVMGTTQGVVTDIDGNYALSNISRDATLRVSYTGYETQEINVDGRSTIDIKLATSTTNLNEVVVVGYGVQRKSDLTGAVSSVKTSDAIKSTPVSDITSALQGRLAGVSIMQGSGQPGSGATIRVRGTSSLASESGPLVVIDGIVGGSLSSLNPSDIASIEVLKDASATAVYGSKGSAGVLLVTTKNPEKGTVRVEYNGYANFKTPYNLPKRMTAGQYAELANDYATEMDMLSGTNYGSFYTPDEVQNFYRNGGYDYIDYVFRDVAIEHNHELSVSGGSDKIRFLFSGSYNDNQGIVENSWAKRANYRLKVDTDIRSWLRAGVNFWGDWQKSSSVRFSQYNNLLIGALTYPNTRPHTDENGRYLTTSLIGVQYNPAIFIDTPNSDGYAYTSRLQGYVDVNILKGLTFRMTQSFMLYNKNTGNVFGTDSYESLQSYSSQTAADARSWHNYSWLNTEVLSYIREFNENHRINATAVFEQQTSNNFYHKSFGRDLISEKLGADAVQMSSIQTVESSREKASMLSYMLRANYVLMNRYMVTASWRRDGSSRLAAKNRWENFLAGALAWDIKQERFLNNVTWLNQLKLRVGYGETGNQTMPSGQEYLAWTQINAVKDKDGNLSFQTQRLANTDLRWERTGQWNFGVDAAFWNNRLTVNLDYYLKETKDVLLYVNMPEYSGFTNRYANAGTVTNRGFELTLSGNPIVTRDFMWNTTVVLSQNEGRVKSLANGEEYADLSGNYENKYFRNIVGEKIATMWGYRNNGVWTTDAIAASDAKVASGEWPLADGTYPDGYAPAGTVPGSYKYKDLNHDGQINEDDREIIGNGQPTFQWSWNNMLSWKGFDFSLYIIGVHGFDIYNYTKEATLQNNNVAVLSPSPYWLDRWTPAVYEDGQLIKGESKNATVAGFVSKRNALTPSSQYVEKGDFVKVKSITLGYTLPDALMHKATINRLRIYVSIQNPFLITKYSGIDPEVTLQKSLTSGMDWGFYPNGRNYMVGLNLSF